MSKILFYINILGYGGAERVISNLANQFCEHGNQCIMVTSYKVEKEYKLLPQVKRLNLIDDKNEMPKLKKNIYLIKNLRKYILDERPDVLVSFMAEANFRLLVAGIGSTAKKIISVRNSPDKEYPGFMLNIAKVFFNLADGIVFQTSDAKRVFPKKIRNKSKIIYNQVDNKFYNSILNIERNGIVTVGRLVSQKNHKLLIDAFDIIKDQVDDCLYIYGDGEQKNSLCEYIKSKDLENRIFMMGASDKIQDELCKYRLFVLSSDYEGLPNALMEAMATGIACISTDCKCGGPKELLVKDMYLSEVGNRLALSDLMLRMLTDENEMKKNEKWVKEQAEKYKPQLIFNEWDNYFKIS